jgi:hypothetical protein
MHSALDAPVPAAAVAVRIAAPWPRCGRRVPQRLSRRFPLVLAIASGRPEASRRAWGWRYGEDDGVVAEANDQELRGCREVMGQEAGGVPFHFHESNPCLPGPCTTFLSSTSMYFLPQAYTNELKNKIVLLEEKNEHLMKLKLRIRKLMWSLPCLCLHVSIQ